MGALVVNGQKVAGVNIEIKPDIYSTEEREIGVWTDEKPLYQKTVHISALPSTAYTDTQYAHNISNIDKIISWKGFTAFANGSTLQFDRSFSNSSYEGNTGFSATVDKTAINVRVGTDRSAMSADFTIQYTKTTDQPGAGTWTTDGVYAHHYSTDEKVVGTWVDGSTIYERTYDLNNLLLSANSWTDTTITLGNTQGEYTLVDAKVMISDNGVPATQVTPWSSNEKLAIFNTRSIQLTAKYITIQYTKSS